MGARRRHRAVVRREHVSRRDDRSPRRRAGAARRMALFVRLLLAGAGRSGWRVPVDRSSRATALVDAPARWMTISAWVTHADVARKPVDVKVWSEGRLVIDTRLKSTEPVTADRAAARGGETDAGRYLGEPHRPAARPRHGRRSRAGTGGQVALRRSAALKHWRWGPTPARTDADASLGSPCPRLGMAAGALHSLTAATIRAEVGPPPVRRKAPAATLSEDMEIDEAQRQFARG